MNQGWSTLKCNWPQGQNLRRSSPGWRRFEVSRRRAPSSLLKSRLPRSWNFLKRTVALVSSNVAAAASEAGLAAPAPRHHLELVQPALERPVPERRTGRGLEADQLGQAQVGGEDIAAPTGKFLLQRVAQLGVEARQLLFASHALAVRRIHEHHSGGRRRASLQDIGLLQLHPALDSGGSEIAPRRGKGARVGVAAIKPEI